MTRMHLVVIGLAALLLGAQPAEAAPRKTELYRTWGLRGSDTLGRYEGTLTISDGGRLRVIASASLRYTDGRERAWTARAWYVFGRIYVRYTIRTTAGLAGALSGAANGELNVRGTLRPNQEATRIDGVYSADGFSGTERARRAGVGYRWSRRVLASVLSRFPLLTADELLLRATRISSNRYLNRSELTAAAQALTASELGVISDLDKTIIPPGPGDDLLPPYAGIGALLGALEAKGAGDTTYVTARSAARVTGIPAYLSAHGLPAGPVQPGTSSVPWVARAEKVQSISRVLDANPGQRFVLLGDSSHIDPEAYREIMDAYPGRIVAAIVHKVTSTVSPDRVVGMHLVDDYAQAAAALFRLGALDEASTLRVMLAAKAGGLAISSPEIDALIRANRPTP